MGRKNFKLMIEKYLKGNISNQRIENLVINKSLDDEYKNPSQINHLKLINFDWPEEKHT